MSITNDELIEYVHSEVENIIEENGLDVRILDLFVHGSRIYGKPRRNSDVDVVLYYDGTVREDSLFNILHDDEYEDIFTYDGITIDINPIRDQETGSLESYKKKHNYI